MALAEARLVGAEDQGHVRENGQRGPQCLVKQHLFGRVRDMVRTTDDMRDPHVHIVRDHAQVIGGDAIGAQQHEIFQLRIGKLHSTEDGVIKSRAAGLGHGEANGRGFSRSATPGAFLARNFPAGAFITRRAALGGSGRAALLQLLLAAETIVGMSGGQQLRRALAIELHALGLVVGTLVPIEAEPAHALQDAVNHLRGRAFEIGVLNTQDQRAAMMTGEEPVEQGGACAAHMQVSGGRGSKTDAWPGGRGGGRTEGGGHYERSCPDGTG